MKLASSLKSAFPDATWTRKRPYPATPKPRNCRPGTTVQTAATGMVNQELLLQNEYLAAENRILRAHLPTRWRLADPGRSTLAEIGKRLGRKALAHVACVAKPDSILACLSPRNSTAPNAAVTPAGRESSRNWRH